MIYACTSTSEILMNKPEYMVSRVQVSEGLLHTWHKTRAPTLVNLITFFHLEFGQKWTYSLDMTADASDWFMSLLQEFSGFSICEFHFQNFNVIGQVCSKFPSYSKSNEPITL